MKSIKVCGPRVLVRPFKLEEVDEVYNKVKAAGLAVPNLKEVGREEAAIDSGTVVSIGGLAWKDWGEGEPWVKEGDKVMWAKHAGRTVHKSEDETLVILNDEDVICIIQE